ncbi:MAG: hypothetical protein IKV10_03055 [Alphaproteobacteria bacterium]|nr:hypothetical protein [Alphaproteobacteria bacterium]
MKIQLTTFSKRENSTKQYNSTWTDFDNCSLKENCSIITPRIEIHTSSDLTAMNYAYIPAFHRYYFIENIDIYREQYILNLKCDVLATYKSDIGNSSEYILRAAGDWNGDIIDNLYPMKTETTITVGSSSSGGTPADPTTGTFDEKNICYVIGILNNQKTYKCGAVEYYVLNDTELGDLMDFLLGQNILTSTETFITGFSQAIQDGVARSLMRPTDYIVECFALPYRPDCGTSETLTIGWWSTTVTGCPVIMGNFNLSINSGDLSLPAHPQAATRGHYLSTSPFTRYWLFLGVFGYYPIDTLQAIDTTQIHYSIFGDPFGNVKCRLSLNGVMIDTLSANVKNNFPIGQVSVDALGGASAMLNNIMPMSTSADAGDVSGQIDASTSGLINGANGLISAARAMLPQGRVTGSTGTFLDVFQPFISYAETHEVVDDDLTHRGRPLCEEKTISSLSGYILVADADLTISGTAEENRIIKGYMNSGFYYE